MCGIAGIIRLDRRPVSIGRLEAMIARLGHRGPDAMAIFVDGHEGGKACRIGPLTTQYRGFGEWPTANVLWIVDDYFQWRNL